MKPIPIIITALMALLISAAARANELMPDVITEFCSTTLKGDIADRSQPYNATDEIKEGMTQRRIIGYLVTKKISYIWYEHGGRGRHQHLVSFYNDHISNVINSYVFISTEHKNIDDLINDTEFLNSHRTRHGEL